MVYFLQMKKKIFIVPHLVALLKVMDKLIHNRFKTGELGERRIGFGSRVTTLGWTEGKTACCFLD